MRSVFFAISLRIISAVAMISCVLSNAAADDKNIQKSFTSEKMFQVGEELEYKVSYSFITLGTIKIRTTQKYQQNGGTIYDTDAFIDSAPGLPFVTLHIQFHSQIDSDMFTREWISEDKSKNQIIIKKYNFQYDSNRTIIGIGTRNSDGSIKIDKYDTIKINDKLQDGLSLFYYARAFFHQAGERNIPTIINTVQENTYINFKNQIQDIEIDAVDYPIEVSYFDGRMDFVGIFGLTGGFRGWFSNDEAAVPIMARMNVILGSIKIELVKWNRSGWTPPKFIGR